MRLIKYIKEVLSTREKKGYEYLYFMIDVHGTILKPSLDKEEKFIFYDYAKEVLRELSNREYIKLILWTSTYPSKIKNYLDKFEEEGIHFDYVNSNNEMANTSFGCFDKKFFYDVGIDDKCGFDAERDWERIWFLVLNDGSKK